MKRLFFLSSFVGCALLGCGDDTEDGLPNGEPCQRDEDCASGFCLPADDNPRVCATPGGENEGGPPDTDASSSDGP